MNNNLLLLVPLILLFISNILLVKRQRRMRADIDFIFRQITVNITNLYQIQKELFIKNKKKYVIENEINLAIDSFGNGKEYVVFEKRTKRLQKLKMYKVLINATEAVVKSLFENK